MHARWLIALLTLLVIVFGSLTIRILCYKHFTIDEFQYAHASWLVAQGQVPYLDFFDDRFPLLYQALGVLPPLKYARPQDIILLRWAMLPLLALTLALHGLLNVRRGAITVLLGIALLLSTSTFTARATEIRPDPLAFALFLGALVLLSSQRLSDKLAAFLAGSLLAASLWASLKVLSYGCIFAVALLLRRRKIILRHPPMFVAGFAAVAALVAMYLLSSGSTSDWFVWSVKWAYVHEAYYPRIAWITTAAPFLREDWWMIAFGLIGWLDGLRSRERETLLLLALPLTFFSFAAQRAPFEYSLIPFIGILTIYASRGLVLAFGAARGIVMAILIMMCLYGGTIAFIRSRQAMWPTAEGQLATLRQLGLLTSATDAVYDNTGAYFARPHAWYFFYTDEVLRRRLSATMTFAVEEALLRSQAPAVLMDLRFNGLPPQLQAFIREHYQPYGGDIRLWGMRFGPAQTIDGQFRAIQSGTYFLYPADILQSGVLTIAGRRITSPLFALSAGENRVSFAGRPSEFMILWLPRDGKPYVPATPPARSLFSFL